MQQLDVAFYSPKGLFDSFNPPGIVSYGRHLISEQGVDMVDSVDCTLGSNPLYPYLGPNICFHSVDESDDILDSGRVQLSWGLRWWARVSWYGRDRTFG